MTEYIGEITVVRNHEADRLDLFDSAGTLFGWVTMDNLRSIWESGL